MARPIPRFELGDTRQFLATYSVAPGTQPLFNLHAGSGTGTLVHSVLATSSSSTAWFVPYTFPQSKMLYVYTFVASYTDGPVVDRGYAHVLHTTPG